ncbi:MAG TPA: hypothetical protein VEQ40_04020 [Pyrinomonadaceae bacterium]|nr:hypothetical protein [Pyrinomonadaceae bacterium]
MITGFNTDVEHEGTVYHVQTEDKGLDSPLILSLVYVGGAILASKRSRYDDLIEKGFDEKELSERLNRQHKLICAAIRAGRIEDLKRMSQRESSASTVSSPPAPEKVSPPPVEPLMPDEPNPLELPPLAPAFEAAPPAQPPVIEPEPKPVSSPPSLPADAKAKKATAPAQKSAKQPAKQNVRAILQDVVADFARAEAASDAGIHLSLVGEDEFRGGSTALLKIRVGRGSNGREAIDGADITVKVLGSTFRPLIFPTRTGPDGIAQVRAVLPHFKTGRAAILVRAIADGYEAELRRIIQQG